MKWCFVALMFFVCSSFHAMDLTNIDSHEPHQHLRLDNQDIKDDLTAFINEDDEQDSKIEIVRSSLVLVKCPQAQQCPPAVKDAK